MTHAARPIRPLFLALAAPVVIALLVAPAPSAQQEPPATPAPTAAEPQARGEKAVAGQIGGLRFVDTTEVTIVNVDVTVTDQKKGPVYGLTKDDFLVLQDRKQQEITNFYFFADEGPAPPAEATPVPTAPAPTATPQPAAPVGAVAERQPLFIAIYVDSENVLPFNRNRVLAKVNEFVRERVKPPDQAMVVSYQRSLKIIQPFTSDAERIVDSLRVLRTYAGGRVQTISQKKDIEEQIRREMDGSQGGNQDVDRLFGIIRSFAQEERNNLNFTIGALQEIISMMSGLPGRKAVLYASDGLPMVPGLELYYEVLAHYNNPGVLTHAMDNDARDLFQRLVRSAQASGITFYTIDCRGLEADLGIEAENRTARSPMAASMGMHNYQDGIIYIAEETGGKAVYNTNDVGPALSRIGKELTTYYSLGYRLVPSGKDRVHKIEVKLREGLDYDLQYRRTFIEKTLATRIGDRVMSGLAFDLDDNPLGVSLETGEPYPASGSRWLLPVTVRIPVSKIALIPDGDDLAGFITVYYAARDDEGKQSDLQHSEHPLKLPAAKYEAAKPTAFTVDTSLLLEPGTYRIAIGVHDQLTNQAGYAVVRRPVHPEKNR